MFLVSHCIVVLLLLTVDPGTPPPQAATSPATGEAAFTIFVRGKDIGREQVNLARSGWDWIITSGGQFGDLTINSFALKYAADWQPIELRIEAIQGQRKLRLTTSFGLTTAINEITQDDVTNSKTDQISARAVVLPNNFYAGYEALAARLAALEAGAELPIYVAPQGEVKLAVKAVTPERLQTPVGTIETRKYDVSFQNIGGLVSATITIDSRSRFARLDIPAATLSVVRSDLAGVSVRRQTLRNPNDSDVSVAAHGFSLAGTLPAPAASDGRRHPAVVLVGGSGAADRDETVAGIPIFGQLAGALAQRGFMVLRYDKRGVGQSGGRTESATLQDYADDLIAAIKWLAKRSDVDPRRIAVLGHSEGGAVAMLAAEREKRINALVLVATPGTTGAELVLEQQLRQLDAMKLPDSERQAKIELQKRIQTAVTSEKGWEGVSPELRRQADTPWFRSLLLFDPARVMPHVKQPILILQGELDTQVVPHHADRLAALAKSRKKAGTVEVVHVEGINHLLVPAGSGEVAEYAQLTDPKVSPKISEAIVSWLRKS